VTLTVMDRNGTVIGSHAKPVPEDTSIARLIIGPDQRVHASTVRFDAEASSDNLKVNVLTVSAAGALSSTDVPAQSYMPGPVTIPGLMTTDKAGNVYITGSKSGTGNTRTMTHLTLRAMVYRIDTANVLKPIVQGRNVAHSFTNDNPDTCLKCFEIPDLQVFSSLKVLDDGALLLGWSNATWKATGVYGDVVSEVVTSDFSVSKIPARHFIR
jgi:hypothetical protein